MKHRSDLRFVILLLKQEYTINSYDQHEYIGISQCTRPLVSYLLYSKRRKINGHNYSIQIDIYENHRRLKYRASCLFPLSFPFLPVHRVAFNLVIPPSDFILQDFSDCKRSCIDGFSTHSMNNYGDFCRCFPGWSGSICSV